MGSLDECVRFEAKFMVRDRHRHKTHSTKPWVDYVKAGLLVFDDNMAPRNSQQVAAATSPDASIASDLAAIVRSNRSKTE